MNELTRDKMSMFMGQLTGKFTSRQTAKHAFDLSKSILNWAVARDLLVKSPAYKLAVQLNDGRGEPASRSLHTRAEVRIIFKSLAELREHPNKQVRRSWIKYSALIALIASTGVRVSEALGIERGDISEDFTSITLRRKVDQSRRGRPDSDRVGKMKSANAYRTVPIGSLALHWLIDHLATHEHDFVFCTKAGLPMRHSQVNNYGWYRVQRIAGVRQRGLHTLRHMFASELMLRGKYLEAQELLGHHNASFTMSQYGHLIGDARTKMQAIANMVAETFMPPPRDEPNDGEPTASPDETLIPNKTDQSPDDGENQD